MDICPWLQHKINKNINRKAGGKKKHLNAIKRQVNYGIVGLENM